MQEQESLHTSVVFASTTKRVAIAMAQPTPSTAKATSSGASQQVQKSNVVSQQMVTFLFAEIVNLASREGQQMMTTATTESTDPEQADDGGVNSNEKLTVAVEMAAAKLERMGASVGYRLTERLSFSKTWTPTKQGGDLAAAVAAQQLEAVKFLCKDVWSELFNKQIDKLQTNHRGVFVLKDLNFLWLSDAFGNSEAARCHAMLLLAFPCGLIRGALSNLGIPCAVSCDFLADGVNMASCAFNIKVK